MLHLVPARLLALVIGPFLLGAALVHPASGMVRVVVLRAVLRQATTITFAGALSLSLVIFELDAVIKDLIADGTAGVCVGLAASPTALSVGALSVAAHLLLLLGLGLLLLAFELLLGDKFGAGILVKVEVERRPLVEVFVGFGDHGVAVHLDLLDFVQVLLQRLALLGRVVPALGLVDDRRDRLVLDHDPNVDQVVHIAENAALVVVADADVVEQLQPKRLKLVSVVLEQVKVVAHRRQDLVEVLLQLATVFLRLHLLLGARQRRSLPPLRVVCVLRGFLRGRYRLHINLLHQVVLFGVFLELVADCSHDILDLRRKELLQSRNRD